MPVQGQQGAHVTDQIAAAVSGNVACADERRSQHHQRSIDDRCAGNSRGEIDPGLYETQRDAVRDRARRGITRLERHVQEQYAELADTEVRRFRAAAAADREALAKTVAVQAQQQLAGRLVQHLDLLELEAASGRVGNAQFVDQMAPSIRAGGWIGRPQRLGDEWRQFRLRGHRSQREAPGKNGGQDSGHDCDRGAHRHAVLRFRRRRTPGAWPSRLPGAASTGGRRPRRHRPPGRGR